MAKKAASVKPTAKKVSAPASKAKAKTMNDDDDVMIDESNDLLVALHKYFGFDKFKGAQEPVIRNLLAGNDTFVIMPTGGGKSMCYQLPALISEGTAIIVSPLIALMKKTRWMP
jgi:ATP-dependent DNA helicase RecQ